VDAGRDVPTSRHTRESASRPPRRSAYAYAGYAERTQHRFLVSNDGGATWSQRPANGLALDYAIFVAVDPANPDIAYVGMRDLYRTLDGGQTFVNVTKGYTAEDDFVPETSTSHVDQHSMVFHPFDSSTLYLGNDGGVFLSKDRGTSYESLSGTLSLVQAYGIAAHPTDPTALYLGTQDNGLERRRPDGTWREIVTGDYGSIPSQFRSGVLPLEVRLRGHSDQQAFTSAVFPKARSIRGPFRSSHHSNICARRTRSTSARGVCTAAPISARHGPRPRASSI
jgi:hypothetical protein